MRPIRIGVAHWGAGLAPVFAAVESGALRAEGLDAELVFVPGHPNALRALIAGEVDVINSVGPEVIRANDSSGGDAVIIASAIGRSAQVISARPGLTTREQLRGRRWGITARGEADECSIHMAFERWGWDPARDAEIVVVGEHGPRLDLLLDPTRADVAVMHAPEQFLAARRGWTAVEDLARLDVAFQNSCAATTRRFAAAHRGIALAYVRAFCAGVWRFRTDAAFGAAVLQKYAGVDAAISGSAWTLFARHMGGMMHPSREGVREAGRVLTAIGAIRQAPPPEASIDQSLVAELEREGFFEQLMGLPMEYRAQAAA